jgi:hypothetical protein
LRIAYLAVNSSKLSSPCEAAAEVSSPSLSAASLELVLKLWLLATALGKTAAVRDVRGTTWRMVLGDRRKVERAARRKSAEDDMWIVCCGVELLLLELRERSIEDFGVEVERYFGGRVIGWCWSLVSQRSFSAWHCPS